MIKLFDLLRKQSNNFISCISSLVSINIIKKKSKTQVIVVLNRLKKHPFKEQKCYV